jgi:uncharacterized RDD family membrane protein YckC
VLGLLTLTVLLWVWPILYFTVSFLYRSATIGTGSATLGMRLMNIELRNGLGQRLSAGEAMVHTGLYLVLSASMILQLVSIGLIAVRAATRACMTTSSAARRSTARGARDANQRRKNVLRRGSPAGAGLD